MRFLTITFLILLGMSLRTYAEQKRDLLQNKASLQAVKAALVANQDWVPYPAYADRAGWEQLSGSYREHQIQNGEKYLSYEWRVIKATDYLEFEKSGSRTIMESPMFSNSNVLSSLVLAELCEGKGRFIDQIVNGTWYFMELTSWASSAHLVSAQRNRRALPDFREHIIDLGAGDMGSLLSWIHYYFKESFDRVDPSISARLEQSIRERILDPYMNRDDFWWQAIHLRPGGNVNNWNPWCNFNVLMSFMLIENDPQKRAEGVYRTMVSVDQFINHNHDDGACEEGPSYWGHAAGKMYDYLQALSYATAGKISIFDQPLIKNMGEYIANTYVGDGWVVNFADASAQGGGDASLIYRYGKAVDSKAMMHFGAYLDAKNEEKFLTAGRDLFRPMEEMKYKNALMTTTPALPSYEAVWYPETEFLYMKNESGLFFASKGGFNAESHNHNDMGTFSLYLDHQPVFIDAGVGTYTRQTFSNERYTIWTMQSDYHNVPKINGVSQQDGAQYRSKNVQFDAQKGIFSLDLAGAYPATAAAQFWNRTYQLAKKGGLTITDQFSLTEAKAPNEINFLVWQKPDLSQQGKITLQVGSKTVEMGYNPKHFTSKTETIELPDPRLSRVWGERIYRVSLIANKVAKKGSYNFDIQIQE
ncbi:heparinase II/III-like protein [Dyadobacter jejuensis]|uniref:Heparinase II/III-like protein n=1 Tax=Dyadobacter jejuensis TaxID=1082580 RepID=A0A316APS7_9BACT|nr:heparinase II/III family protein [Dyadobacter jejuensis]PWJ59478.1 heparinase II/III-like protein [Dyadobacter jejuensis]